jgi:hypothetical protein
MMKTAGILLVTATLAICESSCSSAVKWPFREPKQTLVTAELAIFDRHRPILVVSRNPGDGQWTFLADESPLIDLSVTVPLNEIVKLDSTVVQVSDLSPGWTATRSRYGLPWQRKKQ